MIEIFRSYFKWDIGWNEMDMVKSNPPVNKWEKNYSYTISRVKISRLQFDLNTIQMTPLYLKGKYAQLCHDSIWRHFLCLTGFIRVTFEERWSLDYWAEYLLVTTMDGSPCPLNVCRFSGKCSGSIAGCTMATWREKGGSPTPLSIFPGR